MTGPLNTTAGWTCPDGEYYQTVPALFGMGLYVGAGTGAVDASWNVPTLATRLVIWHEKWNDDPNERHNMQSGAWGLNTNAGYLESTRIRGFTLDGDQSSVPNQRFHSSGLRMWKPGELAYVTDLRSNDHRDHGIELYIPTPLHIGTLTTFSNVGAGIACLGCYGGTVNVDLISGDDNWRLIHSAYGNNTEGGGTWNIGVIKSEGAITGGRTWRFQEVAYFEGQYAVNIGAISHVSAFEQAQTILRVKPKLNSGAGQTCQIVVNALKSKGTNYALVDEASGRSYGGPGDWQAFAMSYNNRNDAGMVSPMPLNVSTTVPPVPRRIIQGPEAYANTIYWDDAPAPPPCNWVPGVPVLGPCVNNSQTVTTDWVLSPEGCTPTTSKPAPVISSQVCSTTPPDPPGNAYKDHFVPGTIRATDFDNGGMNVGYFDTTPLHYGGPERANTSVDTEPCIEGGHNLGWVANGEWLNYTLKTVTPGTYTVTIRVAGEVTNRTRAVDVSFDGVKVGRANVGATEDWQVWKDITIPNVQVGNAKVMRLTAVGDGFNIQSVTIR